MKIKHILFFHHKLNVTGRIDICYGAVFAAKNCVPPFVATLSRETSSVFGSFYRILSSALFTKFCHGPALSLYLFRHHRRHLVVMLSLAQLSHPPSFQFNLLSRSSYLARWLCAQIFLCIAFIEGDANRDQDITRGERSVHHKRRKIKTSQGKKRSRHHKGIKDQDIRREERVKGQIGQTVACGQ